MRKVLLLIALSFVSFPNGLRAQQYSKGYLDSTKEFFKTWVERQKDFVYTVMDNTSDSSMISWCLKVIDDDSLLKTPCTIHRKIYKSNVDRVSEDGTDSPDNITLTESEIKTFKTKLGASETFKWTKYFFPDAEIVDSSSYWSEYRKWAELNIKNKANGTHKPAYWQISLPHFFRKGEFCLLYYLYYCGPDCGYASLAVYKNGNGGWFRYGTLWNPLF